MGHRRKLEENKRLTKLLNDKGSAYYDNKKERIIRYSLGDKRIKRCASKSARRFPGTLKRGCYKKTYDYRLEIT